MCRWMYSWSFISSISNLNRWSISLVLICHVPLKRDQWDCDWRFRWNDTPNAIGCTCNDTLQRRGHTTTNHCMCRWMYPSLPLNGSWNVSLKILTHSTIHWRDEYIHPYTVECILECIRLFRWMYCSRDGYTQPYTPETDTYNHKPLHVSLNVSVSSVEWFVECIVEETDTFKR